MMSLLIALAASSSHLVVTAESDPFRLIESGTILGYDTILQISKAGKWENCLVCIKSNDVPREYNSDKIFSFDKITISFLEVYPEIYAQVLLSSHYESISQKTFLWRNYYVGSSDVFQFAGYHWSSFFVPETGRQIDQESGLYLYRFKEGSFTIGRVAGVNGSSAVLSGARAKGLKFTGDRYWIPEWNEDHWVLK